MIEQSKFTYSPLGKTFKKQIKAIEDEGTKQCEALRTRSKAFKPKENQELKSIGELFLKEMKTNEIKNEINEIKKWKQKLNEEI